ncbi:MAG: lysophospholipid acyltransferase family protein [Campylobacterales bacterium]|nr:lysophospholipid acyltransferase family protein [Campylobacterales bacterium]
MVHIETMVRSAYPAFYNKIPSIVLRPSIELLKRLFHEKEVNSFLDTHSRLYGLDFVEAVLDHLHISYTANQQQLENIPSIGKVIVVANHPLGAADALTLLKMVSDVRQDKKIKIVANQMLSHIPQLSQLLIPVDNLHGKLTRRSLQAIDEALDNEEAIIFFPAGEVSRASFSGVKDSHWKNGFVKIAQRTYTPVLPVHISARNSSLFYALSYVYKPLSAFLLGHELIRSRSSKPLAFKIGEIIPPASFQNPSLKASQYARLFRKHLYRMAKGRKGFLQTEQCISRPVERQLLRSELKSSERLETTTDGKEIYLVEADNSSTVIKEIGRLREYTFRKVGEGTGSKRDIDRFDEYYMHLVLWDDEALEIAGAYRIGDCAWILSWLGKEGLYMNELCTMDEGLDARLEHAIELGRSFVQPKYWGSRALDYLWQGIGAYLSHNPHIRYMYGPVSISNAYPKAAKDILVYFYSRYFKDESQSFSAKFPYLLSKNTRSEFDELFGEQTYNEAFRTLKSYLKGFEVTVPTLYKQYGELCEEGGVKFFDFGSDPDFNNAVDGYLLLDLNRLKEEKRRRYLNRA